ncbi:hypothetical protein HA402_005375 [Bradysia odoriphaga]|nr:hypothetical protein HA402_005375 [Bradysia odoriphaga]
MDIDNSSPQATSALPKPTPKAPSPPADEDHYKEAMEHDPTDMTFYNNAAEVYFEQKDYEKCIYTCEKGIEIGRENRADFKLTAKAFSRIGNAYKKMENWSAAIKYFEKSIIALRK